jgi:hypothetical protein
MICRRTFVLAAAGSLIAARAGFAKGVFNDSTFKVVRKGDDIGRHVIRFRQQPDGTQVTTAIDIKVKMAFITVASFKQDAVETWRDGILINGKSRIVDDGEISDVTLEARDEELLVQGPKGRVKVPLGTMTDISFWNQDIVQQAALVDTQTTDIIKLSTGKGVREMVDLGNGRKAEGTRYALSGSKGRSGDVWYDDQGRFMRTSFMTRGERLDYYPM